MERIRGVFAWETDKKEKAIEQIILQHAEKGFECVLAMHDSMEALIQDDIENKNKFIEKTKKAEKDGDELKRMLIERLIGGKFFFPTDKADLIVLNEKLNDIADNAKGVVRLLEFFEKKHLAKLDKKFLENSQLAVKAKKKLNTAIKSLLNKDTQMALEKCAQIDILEKEGDENRRELIKLLIQKRLNPQMTILVYELIDSFEDVIDSIKETAEKIRILAIKRQ